MAAPYPRRPLCLARAVRRMPPVTRLAAWVVDPRGGVGGRQTLASSDICTGRYSEWQFERSA